MACRVVDILEIRQNPTNNTAVLVPMAQHVTERVCLHTVIKQSGDMARTVRGSKRKVFDLFLRLALRVEMSAKRPRVDWY